MRGRRHKLGFECSDWEMLSDTQVQSLQYCPDVRAEAGLVCSLGTRHRLFRAVGLAKVTKGVRVDGEEVSSRRSR